MNDNELFATIWRCVALIVAIGISSGAGCVINQQLTQVIRLQTNCGAPSK